MIRAIKCFFRFHVEPRGWNPRFSWGYRCPACRTDIKGDLR